MTNELQAIFEARRVKAPELKSLDAFVNGLSGWFVNRRPILRSLRAQAERIEQLEEQVSHLSEQHFKERVGEVRDLARLGRLEGEALDRAVALVREAARRAVGMRPFPVQIMGALAMHRGYIAEMATGEGKTLTAALAASLLAWAGRPVHVITVNDYLVARDAREMEPIYTLLGLSVGHVIHETGPGQRHEHYRRNIVYCTSKELVADFLRDQIVLGTLRNSTQTSVGMMMSPGRRPALLVPGLFRVLVDEADSLLVDEAVTPLIISNSPDEEPNASLYQAADQLARYLDHGRDFTIDWAIRHVDLTPRGSARLDEMVEESGFWRGRNRREELVTQALTAQHCYNRDEQYLVSPDGKVQIIDEFTGRVMPDRSWRHGLHQAVEVKEGVAVTADKENIARISFQRFFRQYPHMGGMTGTAWESAGELWQIYHRGVIRIPTNRPCIRQVFPTRMFDTMEEKWQAVVERVCELNDRKIPILLGTRSVNASEELSRRLSDAGRAHRVLNAAQNKQEAEIVAQAGQEGQITVATNMAGRGTDIKLARDVAELGGLHVISAEPNISHRIDRQLAGRAARQGDPGAAQLFTCCDDDLFIRHARYSRRFWRQIGPDRLIGMAQFRAERLSRFNRRQVLKNDDWMDESMPF